MANGGVSPRLWTSWWPTTLGRCSAPSRPGSRGERLSIIRVTSCQVSRVSGVWSVIVTTDTWSSGDQEAFLIVRNHAGNHGTLSYSLGTARLLLNVMWTSGMNCDHYANTVGVGVTSSPNTDKFKSGTLTMSSLLYIMVNDFSTMFFERQPWFKKQNFMFSPDPLVLRADRFLITAVMVIRPQTDIFITVEELGEK